MGWVVGTIVAFACQFKLMEGAACWPLGPHDSHNDGYRDIILGLNIKICRVRPIGAHHPGADKGGRPHGCGGSAGAMWPPEDAWVVGTIVAFACKFKLMEGAACWP